jgi:hypothetical protein
MIWVNLGAILARQCSLRDDFVPLGCDRPHDRGQAKKTAGAPKDTGGQQVQLRCADWPAPGE